ncbi:MAG TPA: DUF1887 family protein [Caldilineales bacterium]|nr:DUF1887 family protein [Caldilineales bacterium]
MFILISLVGEQPMPILLPGRYLRPEKHIFLHTDRTRPVAKRLQRLMDNVSLQSVDAYALEKTLSTLREIIPQTDKLVINLTGGTKMMALAAFALASERSAEVAYFQSEEHASRLHRYGFVNDQFLPLGKPEDLPELITIADYLNAHLPGFRVEGASQSEGGPFEKAVADALHDSGFEVMTGVRPEGVADQIEIDLVIRYKNLVGIAEVKLGGGEAPQKGVDQLSTAGRREYLGTYTRKFLIVARRQNNKIRQLAQESHVTLIELPNYRARRSLSRRERCLLLQIIYRDLAGIRHRC